MHLSNALFFLLFFIVSSCSLLTNKTLVELPATQNQLDSAQAQAVFDRAQFFPNGTQLSICIVRRDSETYVGIERHNDSLIYIENKDSVFGIGSITKTFTGTMLAQLIYENKVNPNDPVSKYLPVALHQASLNGKEPTLAQLANHTSGLPFEPTNVRNDKGQFPDPNAPYHSYSKEKLYDYLEHRQTLLSTPGEIRLYSNLGAGLLGHILTLVTGKSYEQFLLESICTPLNMQNTFAENTPERARRMVHGRDENGSLLPFEDGDSDALIGCGGIKSSTGDLVKYIRANMTDTTYFYLAQKPTKQFTEHFSGALGWAPYSEYGKIHQGAYGATPGYTSGLIFERNMRIAVIVLTNVSASKGSYIEGLCRALYDPLVAADKKN